MAGNIAKRANGKWRARYRDEAGKEHSKHHARKVDARRWLDEQTTALVSGQWVVPREVGRPSRRTTAPGPSVRCGSGTPGEAWTCQP